MKLRARPLSGAVVVITGASSGIGRATALAFARHGSRLVLVARDAEALEQVAGLCRSEGAQALVVPVDVAEDDAVEHVAAQAVAAHGRIDVWVNAAAVLVAGGLPQTPVAELKRLIDTNVVGDLLGSRVAMDTFGHQGSGVLINVSSMLSIIPNPLVPAYVMSKAAVRGLSLALRQSVWGRNDIHVCVVVPGPVDTPMFQHAADHVGRQLRAIPPAYSPERVAAAIVGCARRPRRQATAGLLSRGMLVAHHVSPRATEWALGQYSRRLLVRAGPAAVSSGNVFRPGGGDEVQGGWRLGRVRRGLGDGWGRFLSSRGSGPVVDLRAVSGSVDVASPVSGAAEGEQSDAVPVGPGPVPAR